GTRRRRTRRTHRRRRNTRGNREGRGILYWQIPARRRNMKYRVTGLVFGAALLGACSHAEFKKMMHGEPERRVRVASESSAATYEKLRKLDDTFEVVAASRPCDAGNIRC